MRKLALALIILSLLATVAVAWEDCPYDRINDPYPGLCRRYVDTNRDGYCDHSQSASGTVVPPSDIDDDDNGEQETDELKQSILGTNTYHIIPIAAVLSLLYLVTYIFSKKDIIKVSDHRRLWNWALLATFIIAGILGLILAACINYGWEVPFSTDTLFVHVELGIAMAVISVFHVLWHWNYWKGKPESREEAKKVQKIKRK